MYDINAEDYFMEQIFSFLPSAAEGEPISPSLLYEKGRSFGFVTEVNRKTEASLHDPELTCAFEVPYWYENTCLTKIRQDRHGCYLEEANIPLCFQADVPKQGNYLAKLTLHNPDSQDLPYFVFTGRRRLAAHGVLSADSKITLSLQVNVTDIIPRGQEERKRDCSVTITLIGAGIRMERLSLCESNVPTLYIAGDSTVTDQTGDMPYHPEQCYCGWGQMLPLFLKPTVSLSNHAHSGLTTESFRTEGHHAIVMDYLKPGDYFFIQFAHNDQKLSHLKAKEGYRANIIRYFDEVRERGAYPVLVTPLGRNTWKGIDKTYNDLLSEYAEVCRSLAAEYQVPLIDLHKASTDFINSAR